MNKLSYNNIKIGCICLGTERVNCSRTLNKSKKFFKYLKDLGLDIYLYDYLVLNIRDSSKAVEYMRTKNIDGIIVNYSSYAADQLILYIIQKLNLPVFLWSIPEDISKEEYRTGAVVGLIQSASVLKRANKDFEYFIGDLSLKEKLPEKLLNFLKIIKALKIIKNADIGRIEANCPGMVDESFDEIMLIKKFDFVVQHFNISDVYNYFNSVNIKEIEKSNKILDVYNLKIFKNEKIINESLRLYIALKKIVSDHNLKALSYQCWPNFKLVKLPTPCVSLSLLNKEGIMISCEGDFLGAVTMLILNAISGKDVALLDFLNVELESNRAHMFHCGAVSDSFCENKSDAIIDIFPRQIVHKPGLTIEFPIREGEATFAKLCEFDNEYILLTYKGFFKKTKLYARGNPSIVEFDSSIEYIIKGIIDNGAGHHQLVVLGNFIEQLKMLCKWLNLKNITI